MPNTSTASWVEAVTGRKARASEINGNFDFAEGNLWPHSTGTKVTNTYYLGDTDAAWKGVYTYSLDPLGSTGVAIGTTTVNNASSTSLELAGAKAILMPRLTTTERDALTAVNGMMVYNSTDNNFQVYEAGAWQGMGTPIGMIAKGAASTTAASLTSVLSFSGSGRIIDVQLKCVNNAGHSIKIIADSVTSTLISATSTVQYIVPDYGQTTSSFKLSETSTESSYQFFKSQFALQLSSADASTVASWWMYEGS